MSIEIVIRCSICDVAGDSAEHPTPAHVIRKRLREQAGWVQRGKEDYCPKCWKRMLLEGAK